MPLLYNGLSFVCIKLPFYKRTTPKYYNGLSHLTYIRGKSAMVSVIGLSCGYTTIHMYSL